MFAKALLVCLAASALPAHADCLTAASLDAGVVFARADGRSGLAERRGADVFVDYDTGPGPWTDERLGRFGIYETSTTQYFQDDPDAVGGGSTDAARRFSVKPPDPVAGGGCTGTVRAQRWLHNAAWAGGYGYKVRYEASYVFQAEKTVKLSGCRYRAIPVEASFVASDDSHSRRWLYFPDLGFGLETRVNGQDNGVTSLKGR